MAVRRPLSHVASGKPGRPKSVAQLAKQLIGTAGVKALAEADLHVVPGQVLRSVSIFVGEPPPEAPKKP